MDVEKISQALCDTKCFESIYNQTFCTILKLLDVKTYSKYFFKDFRQLAKAI